ncbi:MAG: hypothetical protein N3G77_07670, partial [Nitrososphaeria archaeon]|nr:hypothetical protein [Nitrososphaeria archaeon]
MIPPQIKNEILQMVEQLSNDPEFNEEVRKDREALKDFLERYPFRQNPELIDRLTPESLYNPSGPRDYFFHFLLSKVNRVGFIRVRSNQPWLEARDKIELFKQLLKTLVDDGKSIHEKIDDERWLELKGWGGDKHLVKKLLFIYYHDQIIPTFKTKMLEARLRALGLFEEAELQARKKYGEILDNLSVGKTFELYNELILRSLEKVLPKNWDTPAIARLLDKLAPPPKPVENSKGPLGKIPLLYEP